MPLEVLIEEIYKKGDEQVQKIKDEAKKEAEKIIAEDKEEAEEILKRAKEDAEKEAERLKKQEISSVNLEMKRLLLNKRKEILEAVLELVEEKVKSMDAETKKKLLSSLIKKNATAGMVVYSNKDDEEIVKEILNEIGDLSYGGNIDCIGGVILESPDGEVRINLTYDEMLKQLYEQKMSDISKILFGE